MAARDKSQPAGFVYTNIYEIYKKAQAAAPSKFTSESRVLRVQDLGDLKITKFEPPKLGSKPQLASQNTPASSRGANPFEDLKSNLSRLQDLHSRLRFMLKELEDLVNKK